MLNDSRVFGSIPQTHPRLILTEGNVLCDALALV